MKLTTEIPDPFAISERLTKAGFPAEVRNPGDPAFHIAVEATPDNEAAVLQIVRTIDPGAVVID